MSSSRLVMTAVAAISALAFEAQPAHAQTTTLPPSPAHADPQVQKAVNLLHTALREEKRALEIYQTLGPTDDITEGHKAATNAYVAIRSARSSMAEIKARKKFQDPVMDLAYQKVDQAWNRSRGPVDHVQSGNGRMPYINTAMRQMSEVIVWLEQVLLMWP
ncbi:MAG TPA: hypothetical protein VJU81_06265 [Methylomirabilota bacterium]|nr:hypothetical protein [Methylomirabilota bacterium]